MQRTKLRQQKKNVVSINTLQRGLYLVKAEKKGNEVSESPTKEKCKAN